MKRLHVSQLISMPLRDDLQNLSALAFSKKKQKNNQHPEGVVFGSDSKVTVVNSCNSTRI